MKVLKNLICVFIICLLICVGLLFLPVYFNFQYEIIIGIMTGSIVGLITAIIQYYNCEQGLFNKIYNSYFNIYKECYYSKNKKIFNHYSTINIYIAFNKNLRIIQECLYEYKPFRKNKGKKLKFLFTNNEYYNTLNFLRLLLPSNAKLFKKIIIPFMNELETYLKKINAKKFKDNMKIIDYNLQLFMYNKKH